MDPQAVRERLPDYLLGQLGPGERAEVEHALRASPELLEELKTLEAALFRLPQSLPPVPPPPGAWAGIRRRTKPKPLWPRLAAAATSLAVLWLGWFGLSQLTAYRTLADEHAKVARWLADPGAKWRLIKNADGESFGTMLWTEDGGCLMILGEAPPPGKVYQAWGRKEGGEPVSLGTFKTRVFETNYKGYATVGVSLEPPGGSPRPTQPVGRVNTGG